MPLKIRMKILICLSLGLFAWQAAEAQLVPAEDFFNSGAQFYISNNVPAALDRVELGLKTYPDDAKLKKLEQLLKQQQKQNQQQQQQQSQSQPQKDQEQEKQNQDQQKQGDQKKEEQQKEQQQKQQSADQKKADQEKQKKKQGQPVKPGQMTPEEAKKLLDAQKGNEQLLQLKPGEKSHPSDRPVKDW